MAIENIHGHDVDVKDENSDTLKRIVRGWKDHEEDFRGMRRQVENDSNRKIYIDERTVFEKRGDQWILRKSSSAY